MRIIAGSLKGRRLDAPSWQGLRPTSDKLRETIFNVLAPRIADARVLDGFAGTGALGLEALSRGARSVTFIERDPRAQELIAANLERCGVREGYAIIREEFTRGVRALCARHESFDVMLLDPPYDRSPDADLAAVNDLVAPGGVVVLEHAKARQTPALAGSLVRVRQIASGDSGLAMYEVRR